LHRLGRARRLLGTLGRTSAIRSYSGFLRKSMGTVFVLGVIAGYVALLVASGWLLYRLIRKASLSKAIAVPVLFVLALSFVLLPNDAWKRIPAWTVLPDWCKKDAGPKIFRSISDVTGVLYISYRDNGDLPSSRQGGPGIHWLQRTGYDFVEWTDKGGTWHLNANAQSNDKAYSIDTPTARYVIQSRSERLPRYVHMYETLIKDRATGEVLAASHSYLHPTSGVAPRSIFGWLALPTQIVIPIPDCKTPSSGSLIEDTLQPKKLRPNPGVQATPASGRS
jgi:hypothetical protein